MVKKSTLLKKLSSYSALATVVVTGAQNTDGQIIYHDITPDTLLTKTGFYSLDLNGDGITDFALSEHTFVKTIGGSSANVAGMVAESGNGIDMEPDQTDTKYIKANNYKSVISSNIILSSHGTLDFCTVKHFKNQGIFAGKGDKYVGLKLSKAGKTYYGWVRVNLNAKCDTLIIKDYAYNATAGDSITAGEGMTGIEQLNKSDVTVLEPSDPNPANTISNIIYTIPVYSSVTVTLYDIMGRKIETLMDKAMQSPGRHSLLVDVSSLSSGIYFYELTANGQTYSQRIAVTH